MHKTIQLFNFLNLLKFIFNPIKGIKVLYKILSDYPRIQVLPNFEESKKIHTIKYYKNLIKKNKNLNNFFFGTVYETKNMYFSIRELKNNKENIIDSLKNNGFVVIENVLSDQEAKSINNIFREMQDNTGNHNIIDAVKVKYGHKDVVDDIECITCKKNISDFSELNNLSDFFSKMVFGKKIKTMAEFFLHKSLNKKEKQKDDSDTFYHLDRYLPCLKIIYSPDSIDENSGPFCFLKGSHKLDNSSINDWLIKDNFHKIKDEEKIKFDLKEQKIICKKNSLIVAFTNGFHKRNVFNLENKLRKTVFFQYTYNFNKFSLYNYLYYNN